MKRRIALTLTCLFVIAIVAAGTFRSLGKAEVALTVTQKAPRQNRHKKPDPIGTIDGAKNPEMIPTRVAYMLLFRFISNHQKNETEQKQIREYVRQTGLGKQRPCRESNTSDDCSLPSVGVGDSDIDALMGAAAAFQQRVLNTMLT